MRRIIVSWVLLAVMLASLGGCFWTSQRNGRAGAYRNCGGLHDCEGVYQSGVVGE